MSALSCEQARAALSPFFGGELERAAADGLRAHLCVCPACRTEAATFKRALAALRAFGERPDEAPDDAFFAGMHAAIVAQCATPEPAGAGRWRWPLSVAAAAALVALGFWWGREPEVSVWDRPPLDASPAAYQEPKVVPYSGGRVPLRLLGDDAAGADETDRSRRDVGSGLRARDRLRSLVDDGMPLPPRQNGGR